MKSRSRASALIAAGLVITASVTALARSETDDPGLPTDFSGRIAFGAQVRSGTEEAVDGRVESRGSAHAPLVIEMSDPRLDGAVTISFDTDDYTDKAGTPYSLGTGTWRIETEQGAWQGTYHIVATEDYESVVTAVLEGEGDYEGLTTVWEQTLVNSGWDIRGVIFPGAPPDAPSAP